MSSAFVAVEDNETKQANKRYIKHAMGVPLLEKDREHTLAKAWRENGDEKALHKLVEPYARLAIS